MTYETNMAIKFVLSKHSDRVERVCRNSNPRPPVAACDELRAKKALNSNCIVFRDRNSKTLAKACVKRQFKCQKAVKSYCIKRCCIVCHDCNPRPLVRNAPSSKLRTEKAANCDCVICRDQDLSTKRQQELH